MLRLRVIVGTLTIWMFFLSFLRVLSLLSPSLSPLCRRLHVRSPVPEAGHPPGCNGTCRASSPLTPPALYSGKHWVRTVLLLLSFRVNARDILVRMRSTSINASLPFQVDFCGPKHKKHFICLYYTLKCIFKRF